MFVTRKCFCEFRNTVKSESKNTSLILLLQTQVAAGEY